MTKKIFGVEVEGAFDRYQKNSKKKEVVEKKVEKKKAIETNNTDYWTLGGEKLVKNDSSALQKLYRGLYCGNYARAANHINIDSQNNKIQISNLRIKSLEISLPIIEVPLNGLEKLTSLRTLSLDQLSLTHYLLTNINKIKKLPRLKSLRIRTLSYSLILKSDIEELRQKGVKVDYIT